MTLYDRAWRDDPRVCPRCGADVHVPDPPHLCPDLAKRFERQKAAFDLVIPILEATYGPGFIHEKVALDIIRALSGRDLGT